MIRLSLGFSSHWDERVASNEDRIPWRWDGEHVNNLINEDPQRNQGIRSQNPSRVELRRISKWWWLCQYMIGAIKFFNGFSRLMSYLPFPLILLFFSRFHSLFLSHTCRYFFFFSQNFTIWVDVILRRATNILQCCCALMFYAADVRSVERAAISVQWRSTTKMPHRFFQPFRKIAFCRTKRHIVWNTLQIKLKTQDMPQCNCNFSVEHVANLHNDIVANIPNHGHGYFYESTKSRWEAELRDKLISLIWLSYICMMRTFWKEKHMLYASITHRTKIFRSCALWRIQVLFWLGLQRLRLANQ